MSMPSSSALVATTARISPSRRLALDLAAFARQIAAAIAAHGFAGDGTAVAGVLQIGDQHLGGQPVVGEDQRLQVALDELERHAPRLGDVAAADAELPVHHRRIVEDEKLLAARRAVALHQFEGLAGQRLGQFARIGDGGRAADELRLGIVELADALQAAQQVRQVAAVDAAIVVQLVDHDVAQVLEIARPLGVVRQDAGVQHVGIGEHHVGALRGWRGARPAACRHRR